MTIVKVRPGSFWHYFNSPLSTGTKYAGTFIKSRDLCYYRVDEIPQTVTVARKLIHSRGLGGFPLINRTASSSRCLAPFRVTSSEKKYSSFEKQYFQRSIGIMLSIDRCIEVKTLSMSLSKDIIRAKLPRTSSRNTDKNSNMVKSTVRHDELSVSPEKAKSYIDEQAKLFADVLPELLNAYEGKYVLFHNGEVLDVGNSRAEIAMRAYNKKGTVVPLFIEKVLSNSPKHYALTPLKVTKLDGSDLGNG